MYGVTLNKTKTHQEGGYCNNCFHSLGVDAKYKIFKYLKRVGSSTVNDIVSHIKLSQPTVSYHLKNMEETGLLSRKKHGKEVFYSINNVCPYDNQSCVLSYINLK